MAMTQEQIKGIDQLRQRLSQLSTSISSLRSDLERNEPLPTWPSLQSSAQALSFNLQQLMETFNDHRQFLREAHAYPLTNFPGHTQEGLLGQLLRKKLEPNVENWIEEHTVGLREKEGEERRDGIESGEGLSRAEMRELWSWASGTSTGIVEPMLEEDGAFADDFTIAERDAGVEHIVTGLKRKLDGEGDEDDDDEGDGEKMEDVMPAAAKPTTAKVDLGVDTTLPPLPLEAVLKFKSTGTLQSNGRPNQ